MENLQLADIINCVAVNEREFRNPFDGVKSAPDER